MSEPRPEPPSLYANALPQLLNMYSTLSACDVAPGYEEVAHIAHAWYLRCHRTVEAILLLDGCDHYDVAAPLRRCLIEHTIALAWLATEGNKIAVTIRRGHRRGVSRLSEALDKADWKSVDKAVIEEILKEAEDEDKSGDTFLHFTNRVRKYGSPSDVPPYFTETHLSHPDWESAAEYMDPDNPAQMVTPSRRVNQMDVCALFVVRALDSFNQTIDGHPFTDRLLALETEMMRAARVAGPAGS